MNDNFFKDFLNALGNTNISDVCKDPRRYEKIDYDERGFELCFVNKKCNKVTDIKLKNISYENDDVGVSNLLTAILVKKDNINGKPLFVVGNLFRLDFDWDLWIDCANTNTQYNITKDYNIIEFCYFKPNRNKKR